MSVGDRRASWKLALSAQAILLMAVWFGARLMISYRALELGADTLFIAALAASLAAPALVAALPVGRLSDRFGGAALTAVGIGLLIVSVVSLIVVPGNVVLPVASAGLGLGNVLAMVGQQTFVAHRTRGSSSDSNYGMLSAAASIGQLVGPPLVTITAAAFAAGSAPGDLNTTSGFLVAAIGAVLALPLCLPLLRADRLDSALTYDSGPATPPLTLLGTPGLLKALTVSGLILVTMDLVYAFVPVWATENGVDPVVVGWLLALRALVSVLSRFGLTRLVDRFGRKLLLIIAMAIGIASLVTLPFTNQFGAIGVMIGLGICLGLPQPLTLAWVVGITRSRDHGAALGLRMTGNRVAQVSMPLVVSAVAAPLGVDGMFWGNAALLALSTGLVVASNPDADRRPPPTVID